MGWRFTTSFGAEKKQETFSDFLLGGAAGGRLVFSFESSGQGGDVYKRQVQLHRDAQHVIHKAGVEVYVRRDALINMALLGNDLWGQP